MLTVSGADIDARNHAFANAQQMGCAKALKATPEDLKRLADAGISRSEDLAPIRKQASAVAYPADLATVEGLVRFLEDEAAGRKVKKSATQMARERTVAAEAAGKKAQAAEQVAPREEEAARKRAEATAAEQKKRDSNAERLSEIAGIAGATMCRSAADSYVASVAKFAHKWDDVGFLGVLFDKYLVKVETPGVLTMTSSRLSLQNGFGAFKRVRVFCDDDTRAKKVRDVLIRDQ
jgi:hypothetical protein